jgi:hypothetical protein
LVPMDGTEYDHVRAALASDHRGGSRPAAALKPGRTRLRHQALVKELND